MERRMQLDARTKANTMLKYGFEILTRDPLVLTNGLTTIKVCTDGKIEDYSGEPEPEPNRESKPYDKGFEGIPEGTILR